MERVCAHAYVCGCVYLSGFINAYACSNMFAHVWAYLRFRRLKHSCWIARELWVLLHFGLRSFHSNTNVFASRTEVRTKNTLANACWFLNNAIWCALKALALYTNRFILITFYSLGSVQVFVTLLFDFGRCLLLLWLLLHIVCAIHNYLNGCAYAMATVKVFTKATLAWFGHQTHTHFPLFSIVYFSKILLRLLLMSSKFFVYGRKMRCEFRIRQTRPVDVLFHPKHSKHNKNHCEPDKIWWFSDFISNSWQTIHLARNRIESTHTHNQIHSFFQTYLIHLIRF